MPIPALTSTSLLRGAALALVTGLVLAACSNKPVPPCPQVRVDRGTATLTKFREGMGRDMADVEYAVQLVGYDGECNFKDDGVEVTMDVVMELAAGPASKGGAVDIDYFVAIPQFYPKLQGKSIFTTQHKLPAKTAARERIEEKGVRVFIPLKKEEPAAAYDIYVGLQLTAEQAAFNRAQQTK